MQSTVCAYRSEPGCHLQGIKHLQVVMEHCMYFSGCFDAFPCVKIYSGGGDQSRFLESVS